MSFLGIDIGTGSCKAAVYNSFGKQLALAYREYTLLIPAPGYAELNSTEVIDKCFEVIAEVNGQVSHDPVHALCISSQGEAFTAIDEKGDMLCNAMVSSDTRAATIASTWSKAFGVARLYEITGHTAHSIFTLFKLIWLKEFRPDIWSKAAYFLCFEDLLVYRLGMKPSISWPLAGRTMMFDIRQHKWNDDILNAIGLSSQKLAIPFSSGIVMGTIPKVTALKLGFSVPVKVIAGGHDQTCGALGAGVTDAGTCMYATGSVECFCPAFEEPKLSEELMHHNLCCYDFTMPRKYTTVAYSLTGGNLLRWYRDEFGRFESMTAEQNKQNVYELLLKPLPPKPTGLYVLPYFTPSGTPYFDTQTKGAILGLQLNTSRHEILKALLEGVAFEMRLNLELMEASGIHINKFIATGGGAKSAVLNQIKADVLNRPVISKEIDEAGCFGAAMLCCSAVEHREIVETIGQIDGHSAIYTPNPENTEIYSHKFRSYRELYPAISKLNNIYK